MLGIAPILLIFGIIHLNSIGLVPFNFAIGIILAIVVLTYSKEYFSQDIVDMKLQALSGHDIMDIVDMKNRIMALEISRRAACKDSQISQVLNPIRNGMNIEANTQIRSSPV